MVAHSILPEYIKYTDEEMNTHNIHLLNSKKSFLF